MRIFRVRIPSLTLHSPHSITTFSAIYLSYWSTTLSLNPSLESSSCSNNKNKSLVVSSTVKLSSSKIISLLSMLATAKTLYVLLSNVTLDVVPKPMVLEVFAVAMISSDLKNKMILG